MNSLNSHSQLVKLQKLSASLLQSQTLSEVGNLILERAFEALDASSGDIIILGEGSVGYDVLAFKGYKKEIVNSFQHLSKETPLITSYVIKTKKPYYIENCEHIEEKFSFAKNFFTTTSCKSAVLLPLQVTNKTIGVLEFIFKDVQKYTPEKKTFMLTLADLCAQGLGKIIALENAKQAKDELGTILKGISDGVIVRNAKGEITFVNPAAVRMHGYTKIEELLHLSLKEYFALFSKTLDAKGNILSIENVPFSEVLRHKKHIKKIYYKVLKKNNQSHWWQITSLPILDKEEKTDLVVSVIHDITEEKQNEYSKDEFFGIASHELKTPVTSLKAYTQVLKKRFEQEGNMQVASFLHKMDYQIDKLTNLIREMLDVTKIEGGRLQFYNDLFEFNSLVQEILEEVQLTTDKHTIHFDKTQNVVINGDRERIGQVITNFLINAIKYSPDNKEIIVKVKKIRGDVVFSVQDFGIGIVEKDQKHIFEKFYRERNLRGDTFPGLGLGLYIAAEIISRQKGKIWVKSKKGKGSTFFFQLPVYKL